MNQKVSESCGDEHIIIIINGRENGKPPGGFVADPNNSTNAITSNLCPFVEILQATRVVMVGANLPVVRRVEAKQLEVLIRQKDFR